MLTDDQSISTPAYWARVYEGKSLGKVDRSDNKRPANAFDRFKWLADVVEGPYIVDVASGHAVTCKRIKEKHPDWSVVATDQCPSAKKVANFSPYYIMDAYNIDECFMAQSVTTVTVSQALEYFQDPDKFMRAVRKVARFFVCTVPEGEMKAWSQLRIYDADTFKDWLRQYGNIVHFDQVPGLLLAKIELQ